MKKLAILTLAVLAIFMQSCGGSKQLANAGSKFTGKKELKTLEVDKLVAAETDKLRAVGIATDLDEMEARKEALQNVRCRYGQNARSTLLLERSRRYRERDRGHRDTC